MSFETDLKSFVDNLTKELDGPLQPLFQDLIMKHARLAFQPIYISKTLTITVTDKKQKRTPSSYNLFVEELAKKYTSAENNDIIQKTGPQAWKELGDEGRQPYKEKAQALRQQQLKTQQTPPNTANTAPNGKAKVKRSPNGYQLFVSVTHTKGDGRNMRQIADEWHALGNVGQKTWNDKAVPNKQLITTTGSPDSASNVPTGPLPPPVIHT